MVSDASWSGDRPTGRIHGTRSPVAARNGVEDIKLYMANYPAAERRLDLASNTLLLGLGFRSPKVDAGLRAAVAEAAAPSS